MIVEHFHKVYLKNLKDFLTQNNPKSKTREITSEHNNYCLIKLMSRKMKRKNLNFTAYMG
jgi:hypothetical protein